MKFISFYVLTACASLAIIPLVSSCGGGNQQSPTTAPSVATTGPGRATVSIAWPEPSATGRLIPLAAQSVRVRIFNSANVQVAEQLLVRPESQWWLTPTTATITGLPVDTVRVLAEALPNPDGSGTVQSRGATNTLIQAGDNPALRLRLDSTVATLTASPVIVNIGQDASYTITARNADGEIVLESPDVYDTPVSSNPAIAVPLANFQVRGYTVGKTVLTVHDKEAQKDVAINVQTLRTAEYSVIGTATSWTSSFDSCRPTAINNNGSFVGYCYMGSADRPTSVVGFVAEPNPSSPTAPYTIKPLKALSVYNQTYPRDINDRGYIVGDAYDGNGNAHGFIRPNGSEDLTDIGSFGGGFTSASAVSNDATNTVVGSFMAANRNIYAFRYVNGALSTLDPNATLYSRAFDINNSGVVAGTRQAPSKTAPAYWDANGAVTGPVSDLYDYTWAVAVNNLGQLVGYASRYDSSVYPAYPLFWSAKFNSVVRGDVLTSWGDNVRAFDINDNGLVIGTASPSTNQNWKSRAVRWRNNRGEDLSDLLPPGSGWNLQTATAINNNGYILGEGSLNGGRSQIYVLIPQDASGVLKVGVN